MISSSVVSEELTPRAYNHLPINQNFAGLAYVYIDGDIYTSANVPYEDVQLEIQGPIVAYVRSFDMFGNTALFNVTGGQACADGEADLNGEKVTRDFCGMTDTKFALNYNFYGAPALKMADYVKHEKGIVAGASIQISAPTGNYDDEYILNIGSNRWYIKPEVGVSIPHGPWEVNFSLGVKFFTDNEDFQEVKTFEQDPIYNAQMHIIYDIKPGRWISLNTNYFGGGDTYVDNVKTSAKEENYRAGVTYSMALDRFNTIKAFYNTGVTTRLGNDSDAIGLTWTHRWE